MIEAERELTANALAEAETMAVVAATAEVVVVSLSLAPAAKRVLNGVATVPEAQEAALGGTHWAHFGPAMVIAWVVERGCEKVLPNLPAPVRRVAGATGAMVFNFLGLEIFQPLLEGHAPNLDSYRYANRPETKADAYAMAAGWITYFAMDSYRTHREAKLAQLAGAQT